MTASKFPSGNSLTSLASSRFSRSSWQWRTFIAFVCLPTLIVVCYLAFFASPRYQSEFRIQIKAPGQPRGFSIDQVVGLAGIGGVASENGYAITQYLESADAIADLDRHVGLTARFASPEADFISRLSEGATREAVQRYWKRRASAQYEQTTATVAFKVEAFSPTDAYKLASGALLLSEQLLNRMTARSRSDSVRFAQVEVDKAQDLLAEIDARLLVVRSNVQIIDPAKQVTADMGRISELQRQVDVAQADVAVRQRYLARTAPQMQVAQNKLAEAKSRLSAARAEIADPNEPGTKSLADTVGTFDDMENEKLFAEKRLQSALAALASAESDAARQQLYLDTIVKPQLPQEPSYPRFVADGGLFFLLALSGWVVLVVVISAVRDHIRT